MIYKEYEPIIYSIINKQLQKNPNLHKDELLSSALYIYTKCLVNWSSNNDSKFGTYLYTALYNDIYKFTFLFNVKDVPLEECINVCVYEDSQTRRFELFQFLNTLSTDAKYILDLIFSYYKGNSLHWKMEWNRTGQISKTKLEKYLIYKKKWKKWKIRKIYKEISDKIKEFDQT